jgi:polyhydroxybutyrate depolymerase
MKSKKIVLALLLIIFFFLIEYTGILAQQTLSKTINSAGEIRSYNIFVPSGYDSESEALALVLVLHGSFGTSSQVENSTGMSIIAENEKFMVAYPQGLGININLLPEYVDRNWPSNVTGWNIARKISATGRQHNDVKFISDLIDQISIEYRIDLNRVYLTGFSAGGVMSDYFACSLPEKIAAFSSVAGLKPKEDGFGGYTCDISDAIPYLQIHGTFDDVAAYSGSPSFLSAVQTADFWAKINGCSDSIVSVNIPNIDDSDGSTVVKLIYKDCNSNGATVRFQIDKGNHTWPGSSSNGANHDINASQEIWDFFKQFQKNTVSSVDKNLYAHDIHIYPNPVDKLLNFDFTKIKDEEFDISLVNLMGKIVWQKTNNNFKPTKNIISLKTELFQNGLYYIKVLTKNKSGSFPIIISH